ncbi:hypothetical protein J6590_068229, partial [Homalodisca vitripennis]
FVAICSIRSNLATTSSRMFEQVGLHLMNNTDEILGECFECQVVHKKPVNLEMRELR